MQNKSSPNNINKTTRMPLIGYDSRLYKTQFTITTTALEKMQYKFNDVIYTFQADCPLKVGDRVEVIAHINNILIVQKV